MYFFAFEEAIGLIIEEKSDNLFQQQRPSR